MSAVVGGKIQNWGAVELLLNMSSPTPQCKPSLAPHPCCAPLSALFPSSEISEITSIKKEDVISTLQYLNLINYYKVPGPFPVSLQAVRGM